jgi:hypothetical protein
MSATFFRLDGWVQTPTGEAVAGASVAILDQPADFTSQPGSPLATIYGAPNSNSATISAATWAAQQITFELSAPPPDDIIPGSYIAVTGALPAGYNSTLSDPWLVISITGNFVTVSALTNPGTYVSGGTIATSVLPNPLTTDGNGHWFFYASPGIYSVQAYGPNIFEQDYPDQGVGTVAGGSVNSVAMTVPSFLTIAGSPITGSGTLALGLNTEGANLVFAGPTSGAAAAPTFRALVAADIPSLTFVSSVGLSLAVPGSIFTSTISGSPVTGSGTLGATIDLQPQDANEVWAGPASGSAGAPSFRLLVEADLPTSAQVFPLIVFVPSIGTNAQILMRNSLSIGVTFPAGAPLSYATASAPATLSTTYTFSKNGTQFASVTFAPASAVGVYTQAANTTFVAGDLIEIDGPATADATLANVGLTFMGVRT